MITNPVHLAVALSYNPDAEKAPRILVMGKGSMAEQIIKLAVEYNVPVMRNVALAHTLFEKGELYRYIPEETYEAVAEILKWLEGIDTHETIGRELFE